MDRVDSHTPDLTQENIERLAGLFPDAVTEGTDAEGRLVRGIDFDVLRQDLSGSLIDGSRERYRFTWPGKRAAKLLARTPVDLALRPCVGKSVDWDATGNVYVEGDNLDALKLLRETYAGKVKLIYIDPPYNTGHDFVYRDDFSVSAADYEGVSGDFDSDGNRMVENLSSNGRFHSDWCSMIYPRLLLARDFLTDDGAIFISIDEGEDYNLRNIANEIFGTDNFIGAIAWAGGRKNDSKWLSVSHEYILCYAKNAAYLSEQGIKWRKKKEGLEAIYNEESLLRGKFGDDYAAMSEELKKWYRNLPDGNPSKAHAHYAKIDERGIYFPDNISWPGGGGPRYQVLHPVTRKPVKVPSPGWRFTTPERMQEVIDEGRVEFGPDETKVPCYKRYLKETEYEAPYSVIYKDGRGASKRLAALMGGGQVFENPKDEEVIAEIISYLGEDDCTIMDFFSGSATTAHATFLRNAADGTHRKFILVQLPEDLDENLKKAKKQSTKKVIESAIKLCDDLGMPHSICDVAEERVRRAGARVLEDFAKAHPEGGVEPPDVGFRVFRVDSSNLRDVRRASGEVDQGALFGDVDTLKEGRSGLDLLFQVLPRFRIPLSARVEERDFAGLESFVVDGGKLVACFGGRVSTEAIEQVARLEPGYAVFRDSLLDGDSAAANLEELFRTFSPDTIRMTI